MALAFPAELLQEFRTLEGAATIPAVHAATVIDVDDELFFFDDASLVTHAAASYSLNA